MMKVKDPFNVTRLTQAIVAAALDDQEYLQKNISAIIQTREWFTKKASSLGYRIIPSQANFILCRVLRGDAKEIKQRLQERGIFIRYFDQPAVRNMIRISVGKPEHTDAVIRALDAISIP